jgi:hypothetical protein
LKQNGKKVAMKIISHAWRTYKSRFVKCWRKKMNPFNTYKELREEDWERFVAKCESKDFVVKSEYMQWLRLQNELDHPHDSTSYARKQRQWQQEDDQLAQKCLDNPYEKFCGRLTPFMHGCSKLSESGDVSFYS